MSFGLIPINDNPRPEALPPQANQLVVPSNWAPVVPPNYLLHRSRIDKEQIQCRKCGREVEKTAQYGKVSGRRVIVCAFFCHGESGEIQICEDQLGGDMVFDVFEGEPNLRGSETKAPALQDKLEAGAMEIEAEVISNPRS